MCHSEFLFFWWSMADLLWFRIYKFEYFGTFYLRWSSTQNVMMNIDPPPRMSLDKFPMNHEIWFGKPRLPTIHGWCWIAICLARRQLQHLEKCLLCDQEEDNLLQLILTMTPPVFSLIMYVVARWSPRFSSPDSKNGLNSLIVLAAWMLWKHQHDCVFCCLWVVFLYNFLLN